MNVSFYSTKKYKVYFRVKLLFACGNCISIVIMVHSTWVNSICSYWCKLFISFFEIMKRITQSLPEAFSPIMLLASTA